MSWWQGSSRWKQYVEKARAAYPPATVAIGIGLVAYTDWRVTDNISVGYLYFFPLVFAGMAIRERGQLALFVVTAAILREWLGPFDHSGWPLVVRSVVVSVTYALVVWFVSHLQARRQHLADVVTEQRDQLTKDLEEAAMLQRLLLPRQLPDVAGWEIGARLYPARIVAGDFFDVFWHEASGRLGLVVADVAGKGAAAAMLMPVVQVTVRRLRSRGVQCDKLGESLNAVIVGLADHPRFVSLVYLEIDTLTGDIEYVNMGHPPPVLLNTSGLETAWRWLRRGGAVAGAIDGASYEIGRERFEAGDTLLLYTDGASEAEDEHAQPFSEHRLADVVSRNQQLGAMAVIERISAEVEQFRADGSTRDDMTVVVIRRL